MNSTQLNYLPPSINLDQNQIELLNELAEEILNSLSEQNEVKNSFYYGNPKYKHLLQSDWELLLKSLKQRKFISYKAKERHIFTLTEKGKECVKAGSPEILLFNKVPSGTFIHLSELKNMAGVELVKEALESALGQQIIVLKKHPSSDPLIFRSSQYSESNPPRDRIRGLLESMKTDTSAWHLSRTEKQLLKKRDFISIIIRKKFLISRGASFPYPTTIEKQLLNETREKDSDDGSNESEGEDSDFSGGNKDNSVKYVRFKRANRVPNSAIGDILMAIQRIQVYVSVLVSHIKNPKETLDMLPLQMFDIDQEKTNLEVKFLKEESEFTSSFDVISSMAIDSINTNLINVGEGAGVLYNHNILPEICWTRLIKRRNLLIHLHFNNYTSDNQNSFQHYLSLIEDVVKLKPNLLNFLGQTVDKFQ